MREEFEIQKKTILNENNELKLYILKILYQIQKLEDDENTRNTEVHVSIIVYKLWKMLIKFFKFSPFFQIFPYFFQIWHFLQIDPYFLSNLPVFLISSNFNF